MSKKSWSNKQLADLKRQWPVIPNPRDLESAIGKPYGALKAKASVLHLTRLVETPRKNSDSPETIKYLHNHYLITSVNQMAIALKRSETYVKGAMKRLGLVQPPELIEKFKQQVELNQVRIPLIKERSNQYMSADAIERTKATRFFKGQKQFQ
jgi:hypothetical protein